MEDNNNWINDLKEKVLNTEDKIIFEEATNCFLNGQLRAAYIMTWISIVESLKRKLYEFSNMEDKRSIKAIKKIEELEIKKNSTDTLIIKEALECEIINHDESSKVNHFWEQRCIFAHPYNSNPEEGDVEYILEQAVKISLGKDLYYNKEYLNWVVENIVTRPHYLPKDEDSISERARSIISRTPERLHPYFFKKLLNEIGNIHENPEKLYELFKLRVFIIELFASTSLELDDNSWGLESRATEYPYECFIGFVSYDIWELIPNTVKDILIRYLENLKSILPNYMKPILSGFIRHPYSDSRLGDIFINKLDELDFNTVIDYYTIGKEKFKRIIKELHTGRFEKQNAVIDYLKSEEGIDLLSDINSEQLTELGSALSKAAKMGHWKSQGYISSIESKSDNYFKWILQSVVLGQLLDDNERIYIQENYIKSTIAILGKLSQEQKEFIFNKVETAISEDMISNYHMIVHGKTESMKIIDKLNEEVITLENTDKVRMESIVKALRVKFNNANETGIFSI